MNIWKKNPYLNIEEYPDWDSIDFLFDKKIDAAYALSKNRSKIIHRDFKHSCYTRYKYKGVVHVLINNRKKRFRMYKIITHQGRQKTFSNFWKKHEDRLQRKRGQIIKI